MAHDGGHAEALREAIGPLPGLAGKRMFGGPGFLLQGRRAGAPDARRGPVRVGREREAEALPVPGTEAMPMRGRVMRGFVQVPLGLFGDGTARARLVGPAVAEVRTLPPKGGRRRRAGGKAGAAQREPGRSYTFAYPRTPWRLPRRGPIG